MLSYALWQRRFASDPAIVGRKLLLNGQPHEVLGVMGPSFQYPTREFELWTPLYLPAAALESRRDYSYLCIARLAPGVTVEQARAHMDLIAGNLSRQYPQTNKGSRVFVGPMLTEMTGSVRRALWILLAAVGVLFAVGCGNLANLLLARAANRRREFSLRASLGASPSRLARQCLAEAIPLAALGTVLGIVGAHGLLRVLIPLLPASMPRVEEIGLHGPVLLSAVLLSIATAFAIALAPAARARADVARGPTTRGRVRDVLLVTEIACTVVLLVGAGLLMKSFGHLRATDPGFESAGALSLHIAVNRAKHGDDAGVARHLARLIDRVRTVRGVTSVGIVNRLPLGGQVQAGAVRFENRDEGIDTDWRTASGDYFAALGVPLLAGLYVQRTRLTRSPSGGHHRRAARARSVRP